MNKKDILEKKLKIYRKMIDNKKEALLILKQEQDNILPNSDIPDINKVLRERGKK